MADINWEDGFLQPVEDLTTAQIEEACEMALANANDLLHEASLLRERDHCARAYFLAHIACEEVGKLPILIYAATAIRMGADVDWTRTDRLLRSHGKKIERVLFMDSVVGQTGVVDGKEAYDEDVGRMRTYTDFKNASLYSFHTEGRFYRPQEAIPCEFADGLLELARKRVAAFESMYLKPLREVGGLDEFYSEERFERTAKVVEGLTGPEGEEAFAAFEQTGDEGALREFFKSIVDAAVEREDDSTM
jgi:AbiV family abortive infection protein